MNDPVIEQIQTMGNGEIIRKVLRELGLRNRTHRSKYHTEHADFGVRAHIHQGHYRRTGERVTKFTFVVLYTRNAHEVVAKNARLIEQQTDALGFKWTVKTRTGSDGNVYAHVTY